ncbi:MAG TPA: hypothetical protein DDY78_06825 [Planctomycetales bacterium]|nr:hypothetical protein [Planctomycetales bacterium]
MTGTFTHFPRNQFPRPFSSKRVPTPIQPRPEAEAMLRDMAYVFHITRSLKESIMAGRDE